MFYKQIQCYGITNRFEAMLTDVGPIFNNQNTILMATFGHGKLMLVHETRLFYFKGEGIDDFNRESNEVINAIIGNIYIYICNIFCLVYYLYRYPILGVFTTRKYRLSWSLYLLSKNFGCINVMDINYTIIF